MSDARNANSVTLRNRKPLTPPFHRHIARSKLMNKTCQVGDQIIMYDVVATEPNGEVRVTAATQFEFE